MVRTYIAELAEIVHFRIREGENWVATQISSIKKRKRYRDVLEDVYGDRPTRGKIRTREGGGGEIGKWRRGIRQMWRRGDGTRTLFGKKKRPKNTIELR